MSVDVWTVTLNPAIDQTITVPGLTVGAVHRATAVRSDAGGKGVNVAATLADWEGASIHATGILGSGNAAPFEALFAAKGIADRFVRVAGETRTNIKLVDPAAGGDTTDINLPGLRVDARDLDRVRESLLGAAAGGAIVALSGSLPRGVDADSYAALTAELNAAGARVVLDASEAPLRAALGASREALPFCVKPNRHELQEWAGRDLSGRPELLAAARALADRGVALVVISLGADGALFVRGAQTLHAKLPFVEATSTVGAGDAMVAGLLAALRAGAELEPTARLATAFAAGKLQRPGPHLPDVPTVRALARTVAITPAAAWAECDVAAPLPVI